MWGTDPRVSSCEGNNGSNPSSSIPSGRKVHRQTRGSLDTIRGVPWWAPKRTNTFPSASKWCAPIPPASSQIPLPPQCVPLARPSTERSRPCSFESARSLLSAPPRPKKGHETEQHERPPSGRDNPTATPPCQCRWQAAWVNTPRCASGWEQRGGPRQATHLGR